MISIHAPRAGSDGAWDNERSDKNISIHAPRAGSDGMAGQTPRHPCYFNPCSPCGERPMTNGDVLAAIEFQSMLPVRGATCPPAFGCHSHCDFNPCSPCGERPAMLAISVNVLEFQSMLPVRGATSAQVSRISGYSDFNPCSPCGERPPCPSTCSRCR